MRAPLDPRCYPRGPCTVRPLESTLISARWPTCMFFSCVSLKFAVTHMSSSGTTESSCWPADVHAHFDVFRDDAVDRRDDLCVLQIQFRLFDCGLLRFSPRRPKRRAPAWTPPGSGRFCVRSNSRGLARVWLVPAYSCCADAALDSRADHISRAGRRRSDGLIVLLLRNFLLVDELLVARESFCAFTSFACACASCAFGGVVLLLCGKDAGLGVFNVRLAEDDLAAGIHRGYRHVDILRLGSGLRVRKIGSALSSATW